MDLGCVYPFIYLGYYINACVYFILFLSGVSLDSP